jgi:hypothetical protein
MGRVCAKTFPIQSHSRIARTPQSVEKERMDFCVRPSWVQWVRACVIAVSMVGTHSKASAATPLAIRETVGHKADGRSVTPVNQTLTPLGRQIELTGLRPQVLALSPDGSRLLVSGKTSELLVLSPVTGEILQRVALPSEGRNSVGLGHER